MKRCIKALPITRTTGNVELEFAKYVDMHKLQATETSKDTLDEIQKRFFSSNHYAEEENLQKIWSFMEPRIKLNAGLALFILDYQGAESHYFFPWLINVARSPATALEVSYGEGPDANGQWHRGIELTDDPFAQFVYDDPAFVYNRERQLFVADLVASIQALAEENNPSKIIDFGAGRLPWIRHHGFVCRPQYQQIFAFDKDPTINPSELFSSKLADLGIHYEHGDFIKQFNNPDCREADLVILGGVMSYIQRDVAVGQIIPAIYGLLKDDGVFFFDLQIDCPVYRHSIDVLGWPEFDLPSSTAATIDRVESMRKQLWQNGIRFSAEYASDTYNSVPSAVMVTLQKVH
ncbi:MAG: hypothetical protein Q4B87_00475 [Candidatus Saccharibacteria bacterium]|nr:hypothetical protein [Candidatus Saccharibacteria bacterium]